MRHIAFTLLGMLMDPDASAEDAEYYPLVREGVTRYHLSYNNSGAVSFI